MDVCNISVLRALLERHDFGFRKSMGQNFLIERWVPERIVSDSGIDKSYGVVEIGPGVGTLTQPLSQAAGKVVAIELDRRLLPILDETLTDYDNVTVINGDALKVNISEITREHLYGLKLAACANLPYYITTPVIERLFESRLFSRISVMVQKEVAERICAEPGSSQYGSFTVFSKYYSEPEILFGVPAGCFMPRPKVDSAVVLFKMNDSPPAGITNEKLFFRIVRAAFGQRRKTLANALSAALPLSKSIITELITQTGLPSDIRGERLSLELFAKLTALMEEKLVQNDG